MAVLATPVGRRQHTHKAINNQETKQQEAREESVTQFKSEGAKSMQKALDIR